MKSIWDIPLLVVDVETSGANPNDNRIIEIACVSVQSGEVVSKYSSLVNPHQFIPPFIEKMTGITNSMAYLAPEPETVIPEVNKLLTKADTVFVGHNARFDWSFVANSLLLSGLEVPKIPKLCTIKLARRLLPKNVKKNLGSLSSYFNVHINNRHRAYGDALATASVLIELMEIAEQDHNISTIDELLAFQNRPIKNYKRQASSFKRVEETLSKLPKEPGVYYFLDNKDNIIYVGKAKSLKERVMSYFNSDFFTSRKVSDMLKKIYKLRWEIVGTELAALLLESKEIKRLKPVYNTVSKIYRQYPFIKINYGELFPKVELSYTLNGNNAEYYGPFRSTYLAEEIVKTIDKQFKLRKCEKISKPSDNNRPCFFYHIDKCLSPCSMAVGKQGYDEEINKVKHFLSGYSDGIIEQLENKMHSLAEELDFERADMIKSKIADLRKIFERRMQVPTSVNRNNLILIIPASSIHKTVEIFFIKKGMLIFQEQFGRKAGLNKIYEKISDYYYNESCSSIDYGIEDIDELKIICYWIYRNKDKGAFIYIEGKEYNNLCKEIEYSVRNIGYEQDVQLTESDECQFVTD